MQIKFQLLNNTATTPTCASAGSAGYDLHACLIENKIIKPSTRALINTGVVVEIHTGYFGMICSRSGLALKQGIIVLNAPGIIDCDYRGEICVLLYNTSYEPVTIENNQRIAQLLIVPYVQPKWVLSHELSETTRGKGGFGSTGA